MTDVLVVGGGIAGAAAACFLAPHGTVTLLEAEDAPGRHATGRSAALFSECYGNPVVRGLTTASRAFYEQPPDGFAAGELLSPRGVLTLEARESCGDAYDAALDVARDSPDGVRELSPEQVMDLVPIVRPDWFRRAMFKPGPMDIDVAAAHQGFLRGIRRHGGRVVVRARVAGLEHRAGRWHATTPVGTFAAPVLVNAAGAWADELATAAGVRPVGMISRRRTAVLVPAPPHDEAARWPMLADAGETFYAKPESGGLLLSPADSTPVPAGDARPDDLDVATAVARFEDATTARVSHVRHRWAGLRTSPADDVPVIGEAPDAPGFFWHAGFGGYGIQVAPAAAEQLAALVVAVPVGSAPAGPLHRREVAPASVS